MGARHERENRPSPGFLRFRDSTGWPGVPRLGIGPAPAGVHRRRDTLPRWTSPCATRSTGRRQRRRESSSARTSFRHPAPGGAGFPPVTIGASWRWVAGASISTTNVGTAWGPAGRGVRASPRRTPARDSRACCPSCWSEVRGGQCWSSPACIDSQRRRRSSSWAQRSSRSFWRAGPALPGHRPEREASAQAAVLRPHPRARRGTGARRRP